MLPSGAAPTRFAPARLCAPNRSTPGGGRAPGRLLPSTWALPGRAGDQAGSWFLARRALHGPRATRAGSAAGRRRPEDGAEVDGDEGEGEEAPEAAQGADLAHGLEPHAGLEAGVGGGGVGLLVQLALHGEGEGQHGDGAGRAGGEDPAVHGQAEERAAGQAEGEAVDHDAGEQGAHVHHGVEETEGEAAIRRRRVSPDGQSHDRDD